MLPHPAAPHPSGFVLACPNKGAAGQSCGKSTTAAVVRCLADVIHSHNGTKVHIEQSVPALTRVVNGQVEHARMDDLVFDQNGNTTYLDVAIVSPFSSSPALIAAASKRPGTWPRELRRANLTDIHSSPCPVHPGDLRPPWLPPAAWLPRQKVHQQPDERC